MNLKNILVTTFIKQNKWHSSSVLGHTLKVVLQTIKHRDYKYIVPALLHDIGKPFTAYQKEEDILTGEYSFTDHEEKSYDMIKNCPFISDWTKQIVRWHYLIRDIKKSKEKGDIDRYLIKKMIWDDLSPEMKKELGKFLKYDDLGKKSWKDQF